MLGVLLESRRRRTRRTGGATMSVALHIVIIGLVAAGTTQMPLRDARPRGDFLVPFDPPAVVRRVITDITSSAPHLPTVASPAIPNVSFALPEIPSIELPHNASVDERAGIVDFAINRGFARPIGGIGPGGDGPSTGTAFGGVWTNAETLMRLTTLARPRYPEVLRSAGVGGLVLIQFVVDTTGRVDLSTARTLRSTHVLFTRAVLDVLAQLRFVPTAVDGRRVRALAEMPFEFVIAKVSSP